MHTIIILILFFCDQGTKYLAQSQLKGAESIEIIERFLYLSYVENKGAAFGILQGQKIFFVIVTFIILAALWYYKNKNNKLRKVTLFSFDIIIAGAIGNLADRLILSYVIDFIDFKFWGLYDFPVFNFADIMVVTGTILLSLLVFTDQYEVS
ncbi:MAG: signal peptidase II [Tissierellales bacterium]|jgi:signal peptidase II|nr:signal peptidase II [Tissierellales bacterium]MBN2827681.1 signal peptidase II [Tissierellales bacterium]